MTITKLTWGKKNKERVNVYIDEAFAFSLSYGVFIESGLQKDMEVNENQIEMLCQTDEAQKVKKKALNLLSYRPHSQKELAQKLTKDGVDPSLVQDAIHYATDHNYQSDQEYAHMMARHLIKKGASNRRIGWDLSQKGVSKEIIEEILSDLSDEDQRIQAIIEKKARHLPICEKKEKDRIIQSLLRMGYSYDDISPILSEYIAAGQED
jgi:regulatory protein